MVFGEWVALNTLYNGSKGAIRTQEVSQQVFASVYELRKQFVGVFVRYIWIVV